MAEKIVVDVVLRCHFTIQDTRIKKEDVLDLIKYEVYPANEDENRFTVDKWNLVDWNTASESDK